MVGRMRYAPTIGYVRSFEIPMKFSNRVPARVQKTDLYTPPSVAYGGAYAIRPYGWVRAALQKTISFSSPSRPLVGRMQYAPTTGYVRFFEIPIRSLEWRGGGVWEVGRWGLPLAGETGVNEFGEEEDDDQDDNNEGA